MRTTRIFIYFLLILFSAIVVSAQCVPASTAAGALDTCFGTGGKVITDITADRDYSRALALQSDGKIVVAGISGYSATAGNADFTVVRYNTDGSLDTTFDGDGIVRTDFSAWTENDDDYCRGLAIQPDGKIIVGGRSFVTPTTYALAVIRYNPDGSLDTTFDGDGKAQFEMAAIIEMYAFALQPDGKILVGGRALNLSTNTFSGILARFNSNGSLDTSFGTNGSTTASIAGIFSVALQPDGKIVAAGSQGADAAAPAFAISRLNPNGSPDIFFGNSGVVTYHPTVNDQTWFVKIRSDNQIVIGGHSSATQGDARGTLLRFGPDGTIVRGVIHIGNVAFWNMTFQPDGKMLTVGWSINPASGFTIRRWYDVEMPDITFSGGAVPVKFLPAAVSEASGVNAIVMTPDNKIVVAGSVTEQDNQTTGWRWAITRLYLGLQPPHPERFDFDGDGKTDLSIFRPSNSEWWYLKSSDGGSAAAQFGAGTDTITPGDYSGDGKTDIAFWRPSTGEWFVLRSEDFSFYSIPFGMTGDIPRPSDFDGDGKTDYIVYRPSQNFWYRTNSLGMTSVGGFGISGDKPVIGDFDGDGKSDLAIFRPSNGQWWLNRSTAGTIVFTFGTSTDKLVPGDYTGDGKTDVAFWRPSTGEWFVLRSEDQSYYSFPFGASGDVPAPGDYDGDGKFDASVFRPSNATWFVQRTTAGTLIQQFGLSSDIPVPNAFVP
jgi:uncharacterized delta-60 repeat protein